MNKLRDELERSFERYLNEMMPDIPEGQRQESAKRLADNARRSALNEVEKKDEIADLNALRPGQQWVIFPNSTEYRWIRFMNEEEISRERMIEVIAEKLGGTLETAGLLIDVALDDRPTSHAAKALAEANKSEPHND